MKLNNSPTIEGNPVCLLHKDKDLSFYRDNYEVIYAVNSDNFVVATFSASGEIDNDHVHCAFYTTNLSKEKF